VYSNNGTTYTEEHSVSFGEIRTRVIGSATIQEFKVIANTWTDWHLIPSSRPAIVNPTISTKYVEIPGANGMLDLTTYLTGNPVYGQRQGSISFLVDNDHESWETLRAKIANALHGRDVCMILSDDPDYYYRGRCTVGNWESGANNSTVNFSYQLDPFKYVVNPPGSTPMVWDTFNFETDYDYSALMGDVIILSNSEPAKTYYIYIKKNEYSVTPMVTLLSGSISASFAGVTKTVSKPNTTIELGTATNGFSGVDERYNLTLAGSGAVRVKLKGGSL